jgi:hypothetical protein
MRTGRVKIEARAFLAQRKKFVSIFWQRNIYLSTLVLHPTRPLSLACVPMYATFYKPRDQEVSERRGALGRLDLKQGGKSGRSGNCCLD